MKYVFISRRGDKEQFQSFFKFLKNLKDEELIKHYNREAGMGIVGVHAQAIKLLALRRVFMERFGKTPVIIEDEVGIVLSGEIEPEYANQ